jgi:hypothetical protein
VRYYIHAVDGQVYGPVDINGINQWIAEGRVVPTTLLQPENSQMRVAASTVQGLNWGSGQSFQAYTPQVLSTAKYELSGSWACFLSSMVICCLPFGVHISLGIGGLVLAAMAYRKGYSIALLPLLLNLLLIAAFIFLRRSTGSANFDVQELQDRIRGMQGM